MNSDTAQASGASWADLLHGANALRSIALAGGVALHAINVYIVTTILPSIIKDIGGLEYYAWNTTLFVVTSIVGSALSARLIQAWGPKAAYLLAVAVFSAGSVVCALAPSMPWMLAGRSIQGLGGGVLFALSYALIRIVFDAALWSRAMALVSGMWGSDAVRPGHRRHLRPDGALAPGVLDAAARRRAAGLHRGGQGGRQVDGERRAAQPVPLATLGLLVASVLAITLASLSGPALEPGRHRRRPGHRAADRAGRHARRQETAAQRRLYAGDAARLAVRHHMPGGGRHHHRDLRALLPADHPRFLAAGRWLHDGGDGGGWTLAAMPSARSARRPTA